jgi:hypothetical protein
MKASIASLHSYPLKSAAGIELEQAQLTPAGIEFDRRWMVVTPEGRFLTQRELPQLALIKPGILAQELVLRAPGRSELHIPLCQVGRRIPVRIWKDECPGLDLGDIAAQWLQEVLSRECRLVGFDAHHRRLSSSDWTGNVEAANQFSDGYPLLVISRASLEELNSRLEHPLPMNRFRPNIVLDGVGPYDEDRIDELYGEGICLKVVKPCTRCRITTTDQATGELDGEEPLRTLKKYRFDPRLHGVIFGQNTIIVRGLNAILRRGQALQVRWKQPAYVAVT